MSCSRRFSVMTESLLKEWVAWGMEWISSSLILRQLSPHSTAILHDHSLRGHEVLFTVTFFTSPRFFLLPNFTVVAPTVDTETEPTAFIMHILRYLYQSCSRDCSSCNDWCNDWYLKINESTDSRSIVFLVHWDSLLLVLTSAEHLQFFHRIRQFLRSSYK